MTTSITVRTRWEGGHRLPHMPGKCQHLHGHSWQAWITLTGTPDDTGTLIDFGVVKGAADDWINTHLDHGLMLADTDPLLPVLRDEHDMQVYAFGTDRYTGDLPYPTVEAVAELLARMATEAVDHHADAGDVTVERVVVAETENNRAVWRP